MSVKFLNIRADGLRSQDNSILSKDIDHYIQVPVLLAYDIASLDMLL